MVEQDEFLHPFGAIADLSGMTFKRRWSWGLLVGVFVLTGAKVMHGAGWFAPADARVGPPLESEWSARKQWLDIAGTPVAYVEAGATDAPPLVLLHGCPFSSIVWKRVLPALAARHHVIAPDLLGLGDTQVRLSDDYRLPRQAEMVLGLLDRLGIARADFVTSDHGSATLQLLIGLSPGRIDRAVITNAEAYDAWPSAAERPYLEAVVHPLAGPLFKALLELAPVRRRVFSIAVANPASLDDELLDGFVAPHTASGERWQRLVRFYRWQLDRSHQRATVDAVPALGRFPRPVLVLWGDADTNFGRHVAERLSREFPDGRLEWIDGAGHLPMVEQPALYAQAVERFLSAEETR